MTVRLKSKGWCICMQIYIEISAARWDDRLPFVWYAKCWIRRICRIPFQDHRSFAQEAEQTESNRTWYDISWHIEETARLHRRTLRQALSDSVLRRLLAARLTILYHCSNSQKGVRISPGKLVGCAFQCYLNQNCWASHWIKLWVFSRARCF